MEPDALTDPCSTPSRLLLRVESHFLIVLDTNEHLHRMHGELDLDILAPLDGTTAPIRLRRFGFFSADSLAAGEIGEISISGSDANGHAERQAADHWRLDIQLTARVTYHAIAEIGSRREERDFRAAPSEVFTGSVSLEFRLDSDSPSDRSILVAGSIDLAKQGEPLGPVTVIRFDSISPFAEMTRSRTVFLRRNATPELVLPLKPVKFPLGKGWTGGSWTEQLARANDIWRSCAIRLDDLGFKEMRGSSLAYGKAPVDILTSYNLPGAIEVFHVASDHGGYTDPAGDSMAGVIISETDDLDENLLAHEIGHILSACHPQKDDCDDHLWPGQDNTVADPSEPISSLNSTGNCTMARTSSQPLLQALRNLTY